MYPLYVGVYTLIQYYICRKQAGHCHDKNWSCFILPWMVPFLIAGHILSTSSYCNPIIYTHWQNEPYTYTYMYTCSCMGLPKKLGQIKCQKLIRSSYTPQRANMCKQLHIVYSRELAIRVRLHNVSMHVHACGHTCTCTCSVYTPGCLFSLETLNIHCNT